MALVRRPFLGFLSLTPCPLPLLLLARRMRGTPSPSRNPSAAAAPGAASGSHRRPGPAEKVESLLAVDPMELEVGYGLIRLVDRKQGGDLLDRITNIRRQIAGELGIIVPPIRVRDHLRLEPNQYVIKLKGVEVARGECLPGYLLAIDNGLVSSPIVGIDTTEPAFGLPAIWISEQQRPDAEHRNYTVVPCSSVLATHLTEVVKRHAGLLTRQQTHRRSTPSGKGAGRWTTSFRVIKVGGCSASFKACCARVPIRDLEPSGNHRQTGPGHRTFSPNMPETH